MMTMTTTTCPRPWTTLMAHRGMHCPHSKEQGKGSGPFKLRTSNMPMYSMEDILCISADKVYTHLESQNVILVELKGCRKNTIGTKDQLLIDKLLLLDSRAKQKNQELLWIDYKKAYDSVLHSWIWNCLQIFKISDNVVFSCIRPWRPGGHTCGVVKSTLEVLTSSAVYSWAICCRLSCSSLH